MTIEIINLNKNYNNFLAVKNINFKIKKGSIVGLLGPNGCGKTTTIGMMLGLIKPTLVMFLQMDKILKMKILEQIF